MAKYMLDRDEDAPIANLKDDWQPPPAALPEERDFFPMRPGVRPLRPCAKTSLGQPTSPRASAPPAPPLPAPLSLRRAASPPAHHGGPDRRFTGIDLGSSSKIHSFCGS
jgi:hypothetical protein